MPLMLWTQCVFDRMSGRSGNLRANPVQSPASIGGWTQAASRGRPWAPTYARVFRYTFKILVAQLAHLLARNHDERFLGLMDRYLPTWRRRRTELNAAPLAKETWGC